MRHEDLHNPHRKHFFTTESKLYAWQSSTASADSRFCTFRELTPSIIVARTHSLDKTKHRVSTYPYVEEGADPDDSLEIKYLYPPSSLAFLWVTFYSDLRHTITVPYPMKKSKNRRILRKVISATRRHWYESVRKWFGARVNIENHTRPQEFYQGFCRSDVAYIVQCACFHAAKDINYITKRNNKRDGGFHSKRSTN